MRGLFYLLKIVLNRKEKGPTWCKPFLFLDHLLYASSREVTQWSSMISWRFSFQKSRSAWSFCLSLSSGIASTMHWIATSRQSGSIFSYPSGINVVIKGDVSLLVRVLGVLWKLRQNDDELRRGPTSRRRTSDDETSNTRCWTYYASGLGFEPRLNAPETFGLPLADPEIYYIFKYFLIAI